MAKYRIGYFFCHQKFGKQEKFKNYYESMYLHDGRALFFQCGREDTREGNDQETDKNRNCRH